MPKFGSRDDKPKIETPSADSKPPGNRPPIDSKPPTDSKKSLTKGDVLDKLSNKIDEKGPEPFNALFSRSNNVNTQQFITFMESEYEFTPEEAVKLAEQVSSFGKVKMETLKKYIKKQKK